MPREPKHPPLPPGFYLPTDTDKQAVYLVDQRGAVWRVDLAGGAPAVVVEAGADPSGLGELQRARDSYGVRTGLQVLPCAACGVPVTVKGAHLCDFCYEVDSRLQRFAQTEGGRGRLQQRLREARGHRNLPDDVLDAVQALVDSGFREAEYDSYAPVEEGDISALHDVMYAALGVKFQFEQGRERNIPVTVEIHPKVGYEHMSFRAVPSVPDCDAELSDSEAVDAEYESIKWAAYNVQCAADTLKTITRTVEWRQRDRAERALMVEAGVERIRRVHLDEMIADGLVEPMTMGELWIEAERSLRARAVAVAAVAHRNDRRNKDAQAFRLKPTPQRPEVDHFAVADSGRSYARVYTA